MRSRPVLFREEAITDLEEVAAYLAAQGAHEIVVRNFLQRIRMQCEAIGSLPEGYPERPDLGPEIRLAPFERLAMIAFRVTNDAVEIVNVFYGGRDYAAILRR